MTDLSQIHAPTARRPIIVPRRKPLPWPVLLYAGVAVAGTAGFVAGRATAGDASGMEWQLAVLLRFMAAVKGLMVLGALGLTQWRVRAPASGALALAYGAALALMAAGPGLIWSLSHIAVGAAAFHAGLLLYLVLAWRDGAVRLPTRRT